MTTEQIVIVIIVVLSIGLIIFCLTSLKRKKKNKTKNIDDPAEENAEPTEVWLHRQIMNSEKAKDHFFGGPTTRSEKRSQ